MNLKIIIKYEHVILTHEEKEKFDLTNDIFTFANIIFDCDISTYTTIEVSYQEITFEPGTIFLCDNKFELYNSYYYNRQKFVADPYCKMIMQDKFTILPIVFSNKKMIEIFERKIAKGCYLQNKHKKEEKLICLIREIVDCSELTYSFGDDLYQDVRDRRNGIVYLDKTKQYVEIENFPIN